MKPMFTNLVQRVVHDKFVESEVELRENESGQYPCLVKLRENESGQYPCLVELRENGTGTMRNFFLTCFSCRATAKSCLFCIGTCLPQRIRSEHFNYDVGTLQRHQRGRNRSYCQLNNNERGKNHNREN